MPNYRIHFVDGAKVEKAGATGTEAKLAAKHERRQQTGATEPGDPRVKVARVEELGEAPASRWPAV